MKKILWLALVGAVLAPMIAFAAGDGYDTAPWRQVGFYAGFRKVAVSSTSAALLLDDSTKRPDAVCYNNSASVVWLGSSTVNTILISDGFPVGAYSYFTVGGSLKGVVRASADTGVASIDVRCMDGLVY